MSRVMVKYLGGGGGGGGGGRGEGGGTSIETVTRGVAMDSSLLGFPGGWASVVSWTEEVVHSLHLPGEQWISHQAVRQGLPPHVVSLQHGQTDAS